jgi:hypothetical protein
MLVWIVDSGCVKLLNLFGFVDFAGLGSEGNAWMVRHHTGIFRKTPNPKPALNF